MAFLASAWTGLTDVAKASWTTSATAAKIPPYNQFISANLGRWSEMHAPGKADPVTEIGTLPNLDTFYATGGAAHVEISADWYGLNHAWGIMIFRSTSSGFAPALCNCVAIIPLTALSGLLYDDKGLEPATYHYNFRTFTFAGKMSANLGQMSAVVT